MSDIILALRNATKLYAGVAAIENVDLNSAAAKSMPWSARTAPANRH